MVDFINDLEIEVSRLIRKKLETTKDFNFNTDKISYSIKNCR